MREKRINLLTVRIFEKLLPYKEICHFVSTRKGGVSNPPYDSLNLGFRVEDDPQKVLKNRETLATALGIPLNHFTTANQIHESNVAIITEELRGRGGLDHKKAIHETDAMVTGIPDICLMVLSADCVPIVFYDAKKQVIGVAHAGWRGTVRRIAQNTVKTFQEKFCCSPEDIVVGIGPSMGPHCYEVGPEVIAQVESSFCDQETYIQRKSSDGKGYLDLWKLNQKQLLQSGIPEKNIEISGICTHCRTDLFYSRRHQEGDTGRFGSGILIRNGFGS